MNGEKKKKLREDSPKVKVSKASLPPKYKFNLTYDSLRCFINPTKSSRPSRNRQPLSTLKFKSPPKNAISLKNSLPTPEPDLTRQVSNSILRLIQAQGITCKWEEDGIIENTKQQEEQDRQIWAFSDSPKSYASTMDNYANLSPFNLIPANHYHIINYQTEVYEIDLPNIGNDPRTTLMIRNIPNKYTIQDLSQQIDKLLPNTYDFLYLPCDLKNQCNVGYGFINFMEIQHLARFYQSFHYKKWIKFRSEKICMLTYARLQGLDNLIQHFQNSKVLNQKDKKYRPIIREFYKIENLIKQQQQKEANKL